MIEHGTGIKDNIFKGYNSIPFDVKTINVIHGEHEYKGKKYRMQEYGFSFPYYYNEKDCFKIGEAMRRLEILATYIRSGLEVSYGRYGGKILDIKLLFDQVQHFSYKAPNKDCVLFIRRIPLEVHSTCADPGKGLVYSRFTTVLKEAKK